MRTRFVLPVLLPLLGLALAGDDKPAPPAAAGCRWAGGPVTLDGSADEPDWKSPGETPARFLWDREYLYFFAEVEDGGRAFTLTLRPAADRPGYFAFRVDSAGTVTAAFHPKPDTAGKSVGEFQAEAKVMARGRGWAVEGRVPWADFLRAGGRPEPGEEWRFALGGADAPLKFVGPTGPAAVPFSGSKVIGSPDPPRPYRLKRVYPDFRPSYPIAVRAIPGTDQLFVVTQPQPYSASAILRVKDDPAVRTADAVKVMDTPDGGTAYDIAFHPKFAENGYVYVGWNGKRGEKHFTRITRYTMARTPPFTLDVASAADVISWESNGHNGGAVCFGPDGMMYVTSGDGTSDSDLNLMGQRTDSLLAKALRIDVDRPAAGKMYSVPNDNPFVGDKRFAPETWAYGLRNPWRISSDAESKQLWVGNNGQDLWETAHLVRPGENYGWSVREGGHDFYPTRAAGPTPFVPPTVEHHHSEFRSLTGGLVVRGPDLPELRGAYLYGDYSTGRVWGIKHDGTKVVWQKELAWGPVQITAFGTNTKGELLICDHHAAGEGGFVTLDLAPPAGPAVAFPRRLSESGLFADVKSHRMAPGVLPYSVNAPFWSDGLHKERFLAVPAGEKIGYTHSRGWNFPDKTVIVKSFAEGEPPARRWVETRLFTKQGHEWAGYSYRWNAEGTDAELVPSGGADATLGNGQVWHFPSRAECLACHSRAANYVLGLCELQMNKDHDYGGRVNNQLAELERLGMLSVDWAGEARSQLAERGKGKEKEYATIHGQQPGQREAKVSGLLPSSPAKLDKLTNPYDPKEDLTKRARSWLHANCSMCHVEAGGGNARLELEFATAVDKMRLLGEKPLHTTLGLPDARLVAPGHPERSVLLSRVGLRGPNQMPPLASNKVDAAGLELLRAWVAGMK